MYNILILLLLAPSILAAEVRIKDIVTIENSNPTTLIGYGLVVGLGGTGDRSTGSRGAVFTVQSISNMLERFGVTIPKKQLRTRNVAAVMVTANVPAFSRTGSKFDVTVSSLGDATSLEGGILLMTPLLTENGQQFAMAQGAVSIGGFNIETGAGEQLRRNHALVGRVPNGGYLTVAPPDQNFNMEKPVNLYLVEPDFSTARRIAGKINSVLGRAVSDSKYAQPISPGLVHLYFPDTAQTQAQAVSFIASVETLAVEADVEARVVINERTGTIVAGGNVTIGEVMISHGNLTIHTRSAPVISQPAPFSSAGQTVATRVTETRVEDSQSKTAVIDETTTVSDLASALNTLGLTPRDIIAIFQSIKQAGALRAKLIIN